MNPAFLLIRILLLSFALPLAAQDYPTRPVHLVVPFQPGGGSDTLARMLAEKLSPRWGQPVIVENRTGAGGNVGAEFVAKSAPDGYTLFVSSPGPVVINKSLYRSLAFDPDGFVPVSIIANNYSVLAVHPKVGADSVASLIAYARANPDKLNYASAGSGTTLHLAGELFKSLTSVRITHVPYKGAGPGFAALLGGEVDLMFVDVYIALPHVRSGRLRALAPSGGRRDPLLPGVPVMSEVLTGFEFQVWQGIVAPAGTPAGVVARVSGAVAEALKQPDVVKRLADTGLHAVASLITVDSHIPLAGKVPMSTRVRFRLTMNADEKEIVSRAAALMGTTVAKFVRAAAKEKALALLDRDFRVTLSKRDFAAFSKALSGAFSPNGALKGALAEAMEKVLRS